MKRFSTVISIFLLLVDAACPQEVDTANGKVLGKRMDVFGKSIDLFLGIPFAKAPIGDLRFKHPEPVESWAPEVKNAQNHKPSCPQPTQMWAFQEEYRKLPSDFETDEDCLYLSISRPANGAQNMAVMVWIYGGGYLLGTTYGPSEGHFYAAENDVIVVSVAYRVGPLGFAYLGPDTIPGNMGLRDQIMGLQWVHDNIHNFGGDPNRVTIFGASAGAGSVGLHLVMPSSFNLYHRAILQSGGPVAPWSVMSSADGRQKTKFLAGAVNCQGSTDEELMKCLKDADANELAQKQLFLLVNGNGFIPVVDGETIPDYPATLLQKGSYKKGSIINGIMKDESAFFMGGVLPQLLNTTSLPDPYVPDDAQIEFFTSVCLTTRQPFAEPLRRFYSSLVSPDDKVTQLDAIIKLQSDFDFGCPAIKLSSIYADTNDVYMYRFDHVSSLMASPKWMGATHSYDVEYVFGFTLNESLPFTQEERNLGRTLMTYWTNFAKSGDPNTPVDLQVPWPKYDKTDMKYQVLDVGSNLATRHRLLHHECVFVNEILPMIPEKQTEKTTDSPWMQCTNTAKTVSGTLLIIVAVLVYNV